MTSVMFVDASNRAGPDPHWPASIEDVRRAGLHRRNERDLRELAGDWPDRVPGPVLPARRWYSLVQHFQLMSILRL